MNSLHSERILALSGPSLPGRLRLPHPSPLFSRCSLCLESPSFPPPWLAAGSFSSLSVSLTSLGKPCLPLWTRPGSHLHTGSQGTADTAALGILVMMWWFDTVGCHLVTYTVGRHRESRRLTCSVHCIGSPGSLATDRHFWDIRWLTCVRKRGAAKFAYCFQWRFILLKLPDLFHLTILD